MSADAPPGQAARGGSPFSKGAVLAVVVVGFLAFLAMLYFIAAGDTGGGNERGAAHAQSRGLNGYAGLAQLLEAEGIEVEQSRSRDGLETLDLLILTPPRYSEADELAQILEDRQYFGPTMVILPKWAADRVVGEISDEDRERLQRDWVELLGAGRLAWTEDLPAPYRFSHRIDSSGQAENAAWEGYDLTGVLPTNTLVYAERNSNFDPLIVDRSGNMLAFLVVGQPGTEYYEDAHWTLFVAEPDLVNNYGLADERRAAAALALVREAGYNSVDRVVMDMSMFGASGSMNLLTLAFQPPFLAATLCLILAMVIIGWRAFLRFGPSAVSGPEIAFGKKRLVTNGAGLIVRARRMGLLAEPYVTLVERRLARALGIAHPDHEVIDQALSVRLPNEEPFSLRAARLQNATKPMEILRAARSLGELTTKLKSNR